MVISSADAGGGSRTLWPLPGGSGAYLRSLHTILDIVARREDAEDIIDALLKRFESVSSRKAARSYLHVVADLGLIEMRGYSIKLTKDGEAFRARRDPSVVRRALVERIAGVPEILNILSVTPLRIGLLLPEMQARGFESWTTDKQVRYRLRWLEEVGAVSSRGKARPEYFVVEGRKPR
jgi:repressor of nif and glnA expression